MKKLFKWLGIVVAMLVVAGIGLVLAANLLYERKRDRVVKVDVKPVTVVADAAALERGKYLFMSRGCGECHGETGAGRAFINEPDGSFYVRSPNITRAGVVGAYTDADWVRAIRHGLKPDSRPLFIMPSEDYNRFTNRDVAALIAYARSLPAAPVEPAEFRVPFPVRALYAFGVVKDSSEKIDHTLPPESPVPEGATPEHGKYVANLCIGCHGPGLSGGKIPGGPPNWPAASNLTPGQETVLTTYNSADKMKAMFRSGKRPDGGKVAVMPFETLRAINDTDVAALYMYLAQLPPRPAGGR